MSDYVVWMQVYCSYELPLQLLWNIRYLCMTDYAVTYTTMAESIWTCIGPTQLRLHSPFRTFCSANERLPTRVRFVLSSRAPTLSRGMCILCALCMQCCSFFYFSVRLYINLDSGVGSATRARLFHPARSSVMLTLSLSCLRSCCTSSIQLFLCLRLLRSP